MNLALFIFIGRFLIFSLTPQGHSGWNRIVVCNKKTHFSQSFYYAITKFFVFPVFIKYGLYILPYC